ncbi:phosphoribosylanthranilate isomerase, partial [bacterium]|nr:phosphoribosylanthranilate isomerase [bacterium]
AVRPGASARGLASETPSGPGVIDEALSPARGPGVPPLVTTVLLTSRTDVEGIVRQQRRTAVNAIQLCAPLDNAAHLALRERLPGIRIIRVVHVAGEDAVEEALAAADTVDGLLLDTGVREGPGRQLGGTGRTHDWSLSARIVDRAVVPVFLAGGLRPDNVGEAIRAVRPFGVDVCSGVRTDGRLDETALAAFVAAATDS